MNIEVKQNSMVQVLQCGGSLDADSVAGFKRWPTIWSGRIKQFVIDCSSLNFYRFDGA